MGGRAPPPLFDASDGIPGVARAHCAVSYAVATLGMVGVSLTDVCSASFTGLGASHAQLTAHVSAPDEVTVILRAVPHPSSPPERLQVFKYWQTPWGPTVAGSEL